VLHLVTTAGRGRAAIRAKAQGGSRPARAGSVDSLAVWHNRRCAEVNHMSILEQVVGPESCTGRCIEAHGADGVSARVRAARDPPGACGGAGAGGAARLQRAAAGVGQREFPDGGRTLGGCDGEERQHVQHGWFAASACQACPGTGREAHRRSQADSTRGNTRIARPAPDPQRSTALPGTTSGPSRARSSRHRRRGAGRRTAAKLGQQFGRRA